MLRYFCRIFAVLLALSPFCAKAGTIALIVSENGGPYGEFSSTLSNALAGTAWQISATLRADTIVQPIPKADLVVTAGVAALRQAMQTYGGTPILATLIPRQSYEKLIAETGGKGQGRISAIWLDQPASRQALFLRNLLPGQKRIGILVSHESAQLAQNYRQVFANLGLSLDVEDSDTDQSLLPALNSLLQRSSVLLALPDSTIYRRDNIKPILVTTYRVQKPVVAFSQAFVTAGALAALYSTPAQIARQTADSVTANGINLPQAGGPSQFAIAINYNVAQALGLNVPDEATIRQAMLAARESR
ncbi:ABC transporter substrate-binding protein [Azonexus sp. IMCC34839]|uniref:ABC transporter substrate-binding protein n=1 Tax=Azonexus sp. IMCC34839 TaxID=3133695 RepID=UPI00399AFD43